MTSHTPALADPEKLRREASDWRDQAASWGESGHRPDLQQAMRRAAQYMADAATDLESQAAEIAELREKLAAAESTIATQADTINAMQAWVDGSGPEKLAAAEAERPKLLACLCAGLPSGNSTYCPIHCCGVAANTDPTP